MTTNKRKLLLGFLILTTAVCLFISGCSLLGGGRGRQVPKIDMMVDNPLQVKRTDGFVVLRVADLREVAPDFSPNAFIVLQTGTNEEIPCQLDDMDNDGVGDEIAMVMDMEPGERKNISIRYSPEGRSVALGHEKRTRVAIHPEYEGIGWESELIAYRTYPDHRNSISIFGKRELGLSLDKFAASVADRGFGKQETWGVNVLDGGESLGCGGFGVWYEGRLVKPLNKIGLLQAKPDNRIARYTRVAADGPVRSVAQVIYDRWRVGDRTLRVTATYSIFAGQRWTRSEIKVEGADSPTKIAAGIMISDEATLTRDEDRGLFYTWGNQSHLDTPDSLGMAVFYPSESFESFHKDDASGSYLAALNPAADNEIAYWFMAAWSRGEIGVETEAQFADLVSATADQISNPLTVTIMPSEPLPVEEAPEEDR